MFNYYLKQKLLYAINQYISHAAEEIIITQDLRN
jgi:hypothetical protein